MHLFHDVIDFARPFRDWTFRHAWPEPDGIEDLAQWGANGLIGQITEPAVVAAAIRTGLPAVNLSNARELDELTCVVNDDSVIGRLAADHLFSLGCRHYAYAGQDPLAFVEQRRRGFCHGLAELGLTGAYTELLGLDWTELAASQRGRGSPIADWLRRLPKPAGLFCSTDLLCYYVHGACTDCGLDLVRDVRLLGVDNDVGYCEAAYPPFSSIETGNIGFRGAGVLERLIRQEKDVPQVTRVPPQRLVVRSGDASDPVLPPEVLAINRYISSHIGEPIQAADALAQVPLSRRAMELKFKRVTGKTLYQAIQQKRVERACMLLRTTRWAIERVAESSGFSDPRQFSRVFRQHMHTTPRAYRRQAASSGVVR